MLNVSKFYKHIFINLLFITISILSILFAIFLGNQYMASKNSLEQSYLSRSKEITTSLDDKLASGVNLLNQISINELTTTYVGLDAFDPIINVALYKFLGNSVSLVNNLGLTIGVYNEDIDTVLSNQSSSSLDSFLHKFNLEDNQDVLKLIKNNEDSSDFLSNSQVVVTSIDNSRYLSYIVRKDHVSHEPLFFVIYSIDDFTNSIVKDNSITDFTINLDTKEYDSDIITSDNSLSIRSTILPIRYTITFENTHSMVFLTTFINVVILFIVLIIVSLFLIYKFSNKVYSPVKNLVSSTRDSDYNDTIIDEFEYIRSRVETLKNAIHGYNLSGKDMLLKEVLYGIKKDTITDLLIHNQINLFSKSTYMVLIIAKKVNSLHLDTSAAKTYIELSLTSAFTNIIEYTNYKIINLSSSSNILFINGLARKEIKNFFNDITTTLDEYHIIITHPVEPIEVSTKFYGINELIKNDKIGNSNHIILEEEIIIQARIPYVYSESDKKLLVYNITSANKEDLLSLLHNILEENLFNRELAPQIYQEFLAALCSTLAVVCHHFKDTNEIFTLLTTIKDKKEVQTVITNLFLEYYNYINSDDAKKDIKYNFLDYIHSNYDKDISLADMASEFSLAVNYVGVLFKEKTGYNFKDYLNTYRINVSKQILLETPNIKIKDLSTSVGFINTNTFIRIFKKYENISPGQYQKYVLDTTTEL
ncbi:MAG: helix-turn-helix domain-containing protein [Cellulosilyticaceae bacterium]